MDNVNLIYSRLGKFELMSAIEHMSDDQLYKHYEDVFRADTPEKKRLVTDVQRRMAPFRDEAPRSDEEKLNEIAALYCAMMELSDFPLRMKALVDRGAMENGMLREDHDVDDAYKLLRLEVDTFAEQYFTLKGLDLAGFFGTLLFVAQRDDKYTTSFEEVLALVRRTYVDSLSGEVELVPIEYTSRVAKQFSKKWFDEQYALRTERARRNGW